MSNFIRINKKKYPLKAGMISEWTIEQLVEKAKQNQMTVEQMTVQSIAQHWFQNNRFKDSDPEVLNTLFQLAHDFGYNEFKIANGKIKVLSLNEERRNQTSPGEEALW